MAKNLREGSKGRILINHLWVQTSAGECSHTLSFAPLSRSPSSRSSLSLSPSPIRRLLLYQFVAHLLSSSLSFGPPHRTALTRTAPPPHTSSPPPTRSLVPGHADAARAAAQEVLLGEDKKYLHQLTSQLLRVFDEIDTDESGYLDHSEITEGLRTNVQLNTWMELKGVVDFQSTIATTFADDGVFNRMAGARHVAVTSKQKSAFEMLDSDGNERVTKGEFVENLIIELALSEFWDRIDTNADGIISKQELKDALLAEERGTTEVHFSGAFAKLLQIPSEVEASVSDEASKDMAASPARVVVDVDCGTDATSPHQTSLSEKEAEELERALGLKPRTSSSRRSGAAATAVAAAAAAGAAAATAVVARAGAGAGAGADAARTAEANRSRSASATSRSPSPESPARSGGDGLGCLPASCGKSSCVTVCAPMLEKRNAPAVNMNVGAMALFRALDADGDGRITRDEFFSALKVRRPELPSTSPSPQQ